MSFDRYAFVGHFYEFSSRLYSGGAIPECRDAMLEGHIKPGDKVVFAGAGYGWDAVKAAQLGADVTVVELSPTMISKFQGTIRKAGAEKLKIRIVESDIMKFNELATFDMVVANFFLNVHSRDLMLRIFSHMSKLGKTGSYFVIGDFELPSGNVFTRLVKHAYYFLANVAFWLVAGNAMHFIYDYPDIMKSLGLELHKTKHQSLFGINFYNSLLAIKREK
jgi:hypothetical protein